MVVQARALATRARIIQAGLDLFETNGYGDVGLVDILSSAGVTKGAFYYHFSTKESIATAILEEAYARALELVDKAMQAPNKPALERLIAASFALADAWQHDQFIRVSTQMHKAVPAGRRVEQENFNNRGQMIEVALKQAIAEGDLLADVDSQELTSTIRAVLLGARDLFEAGGDDVVVGLAAAWRVILRGTVTAQALPYFTESVSRLCQIYLENATAQAR